MKNVDDYAIIIGIEQYKEMDRLFGPVNDAVSFHQWLIDKDGGNLPKDNCKFITAGSNPYRPIHEDIDEKLEEIVGNGDKQHRRLYFFFAGHGYGMTWDSNGLCLPGWTSIRRNNALSSKDYLDYTVSSNLFREVFFFLDCCRDRKISANALSPSLGTIKPGGAKVSSLVLFASDFLSAAYEGEDPVASTKVHGYFTTALLQGLKGGAVDPNGNITAESLINFTTVRTRDLAFDNKKNQTVQPITSVPGSSAQTFILKSNLQPASTVITLTATAAGQLFFYGPDLAVIWQEHATPGQVFTLPAVTRGLYLLENVTSGDAKSIKIEGILNDIAYEL